MPHKFGFTEAIRASCKLDMRKVAHRFGVAETIRASCKLKYGGVGVHKAS